MTQKALLQSAGDGTAVPSGYVGEVISASPASNIVPTGSNVIITLASIVLTPGTWMVQGGGRFSNGVTPPSSFTGLYGGLSTILGTFDGKYAFSVVPLTGSANVSNVNTLSLIINVSTNTTIYLNGAAAYAAINNGSWITDTRIQAVRIA